MAPDRSADPAAEVALGIDVGGSGIKGAPVDLQRGVLLEERLRIPTPQPATPERVAETVGKVVDRFGWSAPIGCTFPAIVKNGVVLSAANVDRSWIGTDGAAVLGSATGCPVTLVNDADAAGLAEIRLGAAAGRSGVVLVLTFGTGIGSALFVDGVLVPNTELGHLQLDGHADVEDWAAASARERDSLSWPEWGKRLDRYLRHVDALLSPDLIVVGGGASKRFDRFRDKLRVGAEVVPAKMRNNAGIVGAALLVGGSP